MKLLQWLKLRMGPGPIGKILKESEQKGSSRPVIDLLREAQHIAKGGRNIDRYLNHVRRTALLKLDEVAELRKLAKQVGEESHQDEYFLLLALHAATVASCEPPTQYNVALEMVRAAKLCGKYEEARRAYRDMWGGLQILARSVNVDKAWLKKADSAIRKSWEKLNEKTGEKLAFLDVRSPDVVGEWLNHVEWNSDMGDDSGGLVAQSDATERLQTRLVHWCCVPGRDLAVPVKAYIGRCLGMEDRYVAARYLVTLGDALIRIGEFGHALPVHSSISEADLAEADHPIIIHSVIQSAYCQFMLCDQRGCKATMSKVNAGQLKDLADLVVTYGDEYLRYLVLEDMLVREPGNPGHEVVYQVQKRLCYGHRGAASATTVRQRYLLSLYKNQFEEDMNRMLDGEIDRNTFYVEIGKGPKGIPRL